METMAWLKKKVQGHLDSFRGEKKSGSTDKVNIDFKVLGPDDELKLGDLESSLSSSQGDFRKLLQQQQQEEEEAAKSKNGKPKVKTHRRGRSDGSIIIKNKRKDLMAAVLVSDNLQNQADKQGSGSQINFRGSVGEMKEFTNISFMHEINREVAGSIEQSLKRWTEHKGALEREYRDEQERMEARRVMLVSLVTEYANDMQNRLTQKYTEQQQSAQKVITTLEDLSHQTEEYENLQDHSQVLEKLPTIPSNPLPQLTHNTKDSLKATIPQIFGTFQTLKSKASISNFESLCSSSSHGQGDSSVSTESHADSAASASSMSSISTMLMSRPEFVGSISTKSSKDTRECGITDMVYTEDQSIIVVDKHNKTVKLFDTNGILLRYLGKNVLKEPSRVTILPWNGQILVSDSVLQTVIVFNIDGAVIGHFAEDLSSPNALCTMPEKNVAVVNFDTKLVSIYSLDSQGEYKKSRSFPTGLDCPAYITCTSAGHLVISDWSTNKLRLYDTEGKFLKQISKTGSGQGQINKPQGLHGDCHGNLFVGEKGNRRIQIFNEDAESTFIMDKKTYDLNLPMSIDTTADGFLVIAEYQGTVKFFRYLDVPIIKQIKIMSPASKKGRGTASVSPEIFCTVEETAIL